jgi:hypothetical protein
MLDVQGHLAEWKTLTSDPSSLTAGISTIEANVNVLPQDYRSRRRRVQGNLIIAMDQTTAVMI